MINNQAYCLAVERLLGAEVPMRANTCARCRRNCNGLRRT